MGLGRCLTRLVNHTRVEDVSSQGGLGRICGLLVAVDRCLSRLVYHPSRAGGPSDRHAAGRLSSFNFKQLKILTSFLPMGFSIEVYKYHSFQM